MRIGLTGMKLSFNHLPVTNVPFLVHILSMLSERLAGKRQILKTE